MAKAKNHYTSWSINLCFRPGLRMLFFMAILAVLSSCGPKLNKDSMDKIELGMSAHQVEQLIGKPDDVHEETTFGLKGTTLDYHSHGAVAKVTLVNDKVISTSWQRAAN